MPCNDERVALTMTGREWETCLWASWYFFWCWCWDFDPVPLPFLSSVASSSELAAEPCFLPFFPGGCSPGKERRRPLRPDIFDLHLEIRGRHWQMLRQVEPERKLVFKVSASNSAVQ